MSAPAKTAAVPMPESLRYRARAQQCRAMAKVFRADFARHHMLKAAADFERIARDAREREVVHGIAELGALVRGLHRGN
ncbi:MAG TPA: hypothetical protein VMG39_09135 [Pseudolabrys sp.]|nr:hypothetical protein [Pseudolabrys sp.]